VKDRDRQPRPQRRRSGSQQYFFKNTIGFFSEKSFSIRELIENQRRKKHIFQDFVKIFTSFSPDFDFMFRKVYFLLK